MDDPRFPIGPFVPEDDPSPGRIAAYVDRIEACPANLRAAVDGLTTEQLDTPYRDGGWTVLAGSMNKPHGLREAVLIDDDGYVWVPGTAIP